MAQMKEELAQLFATVAKCSPTSGHGISSAVLDTIAQNLRSPEEWKETLQQVKSDLAYQKRASLQNHQTPSNRRQAAVSYRSNDGTGDVGIATLASVNGSSPTGASGTAAATRLSDNELIDEITLQYRLNRDQTRAFNIISGALVDDNPLAERLRMHLGGTGGTGKSRVIRSAISFLKERGQEYRYIVLAPTGTAACLVDGSTYHSALKINIHGRKTTLNQLTDLRDSLKDVDIIFIDEVSMVSCYDLYRISFQLSAAFGSPTEAFGKKHVVLAGDFGQLAPAGRNATSLYSSRIPLACLATTLEGQQNAFGRALWNYFTTCVILRENMRQKGTSQGDIDYRTALNNMRYGACTPADIDLLNSRVIGRGIDKSILQDVHFRNVSVITAWNAHRDSINTDASARFASETGQTLTRFYSLDSNVTRTKINSNGTITTTKVTMTPRLQRILWDLPPSLTEHVAGTLDLCIGMPVILKTNEATELCATNGAEAHVVGWNSTRKVSEGESLKTLFVQLAKPPRDIQLEGLPKNVVPMNASPVQVKRCLLRDDSKVSLSRCQVNVLPNFAMSDYGSQGKTRPYNVVDLRNCKNHQSFYTALSRSSSLEGTIILFPFNPAKITQGATGDLRREFRELEILDDITTMRFEGRAPVDIPPKGTDRVTLINWYKKTYGNKHVPNKVHPALDWSSSGENNGPFSNPMLPFQEMSTNLNTLWEKKYGHPRSSQKRKSEETTTSQASSKKIKLAITTVSNGSKRKNENDDNRASKRSKLTSIQPQQQRSNASSSDPSTSQIQRQQHYPSVSDGLVTFDTRAIPVGPRWDHIDWSCAYDVLIFILWNTYKQYASSWLTHVIKASDDLAFLSSEFFHLDAGLRTIENTRNSLRDRLSCRQPLLPRRGAVLTDISRLCQEVFRLPNSFATKRTQCTCSNEILREEELHSMHWTCYRSLLPDSEAFHEQDRPQVRDLLRLAIEGRTDARLRTCSTCHQRTAQRSLTWKYSPPLYVIEVQQDRLYDWQDLDLENSLSMMYPSPETTYRLVGIVYFGDAHFTCRFRDKNDQYWVFDSARHVRYAHKDIISTNVDTLRYSSQRRACLFVYLRM